MDDEEEGLNEADLNISAEDQMQAKLEAIVREVEGRNKSDPHRSSFDRLDCRDMLRIALGNPTQEAFDVEWANLIERMRSVSLTRGISCDA